jgi:hypothetical protein
LRFSNDSSPAHFLPDKGPIPPAIMPVGKIRMRSASARMKLKVLLDEQHGEGEAPAQDMQPPGPCLDEGGGMPSVGASSPRPKYQTNRISPETPPRQL